MERKRASVVKKYKKRSRTVEVWYRLRKNRGALVGLTIIVILVLIAIFADVILDYEGVVIARNTAERLQGPSLQHFFGTDDSGRDIFARVMYGTRYSLMIGFVSVLVALVIGVFLGAVAGYFPGPIEESIMRVADMFGAIPNMLMAIVIISIMGQNMFNLMIAIGVSSVPQFIRVTRAAVLTVRNQEYIESAKAIGQGNIKIIIGHILPNCLSPIIVQSTLRIASAIIAASSLSFLGLGVPIPSPEWGAMLSAGRKFIRGYSYMLVFPGLAIMITVLAFNLLGDGLRDALDPKLKKQGGSRWNRKTVKLFWM